MSQSDRMWIELNWKSLQLKEGRRKRSTTGKGQRREWLSSSACGKRSRQRSKMGCRQQRNVGHSLVLAPCACLCVHRVQPALKTFDGTVLCRPVLLDMEASRDVRSLKMCWRKSFFTWVSNCWASSIRDSQCFFVGWVGRTQGTAAYRWIGYASCLTWVLRLWHVVTTTTWRGHREIKWLLATLVWLVGSLSRRQDTGLLWGSYLIT